MAKKPSKKPRKRAVRNERTSGHTPKSKALGRAPRRLLTSAIASGAQPMAMAPGVAGPPAGGPNSFKGIVRNGVVVFDAGSPTDGTRVEINVIQNAANDKTAVAFTLTLTRKFSVPPKPPIFQLFDVIARDQNNALSEFQSQNIANDQELIKSLLRRIADRDADVGWTFQATNGVITG